MIGKIDMPLSVVVPVYNEERAIEETLSQLSSVLNAAFETFELILVNDGSKDRTGEVLSRVLSAYDQERFRQETHPVNRGYGASLKTGIRAARYPVIAITDADSTYPNDRLPDLVRLFQTGYDMVVGQRRFRHLPMITRPAKWMITSLANFLVGRKIPDINSGLRVFRKDLARRFFPIISDGFSFTTTITLAMLTSGYRVHYEPIEYFTRTGSSKIRPIRDTLNFVQLILRTVMYFNPLKVFIPVSLFLLLSSVVLYLLGRFGILFHEPPVDTVTLLVIGAVQILATGMLADLIVKRREISDE